MGKFQIHHKLPRGFKRQSAKTREPHSSSHLLVDTLILCSSLTIKATGFRSIQRDLERMGTYSALQYAIRWAVKYARMGKP